MRFFFMLILFITPVIIHAQDARSLDSLIEMYRVKGDTMQVVEHYITRVDKYGIDTTFWGKLGANNLIYNYFLASDDKRVLKKGAAYMKLIIADSPVDPAQLKIYGGELDTYAHLLDKLGKKKRALAIQQKAITFYPGDKTIQSYYEELLKQR